MIALMLVAFVTAGRPPRPRRGRHRRLISLATCRPPAPAGPAQGGLRTVHGRLLGVGCSVLRHRGGHHAVGRQRLPSIWWFTARPRTVPGCRACTTTSYPEAATLDGCVISVRRPADLRQLPSIPRRAEIATGSCAEVIIVAVSRHRRRHVGLRHAEELRRQADAQGRLVFAELRIRTAQDRQVRSTYSPMTGSSGPSPPP
jgi:hypothetical protein